MLYNWLLRLLMRLLLPLLSFSSADAGRHLLFFHLAWRIYFSISCRIGLQATNFLSLFIWRSSFLFHFWRVVPLGIEILVGHFILLALWMRLPTTFWPSWFPKWNQQWILFRVLYMLSQLSQLPSGFCPWLSAVWLQHVSVRILRLIEILGCLWNILDVYETYILMFHQICSIFGHYYFRYSFCSYLCSPSGIYVTHVCMLNALLQFS